MPTGNNSTNTPAQACLCESNLKASTGLRRDVWRRCCSPTAAPTLRRCTVWWRRGSPCPLVRCCLLVVVVLILVSVERHDGVGVVVVLALVSVERHDVVGGVPHRRLSLQRGGRTDNRHGAGGRSTHSTNTTVMGTNSSQCGHGYLAARSTVHTAIWRLANSNLANSGNNFTDTVVAGVAVPLLRLTRGLRATATRATVQLPISRMTIGGSVTTTASTSGALSCTVAHSRMQGKP